MTTRADVVRVARSYIGTPYHHQGRVPSVGLDCAGVLICTGRELMLIAPDFDVPAYSLSPDGSLIKWCDQYMGPEVSQAAMQAGDAVIASVETEPQHMGILTNHVYGCFGIIHSTSFANAGVIETRLMFSRVMKFVAAYTLPGIT